MEINQMDVVTAYLNGELKEGFSDLMKKLELGVPIGKKHILKYYWSQFTLMIC